jgi:GAF domain-containing protein
MNQSSEESSNREAQVVNIFLELADTLVADFDIVDSLTVLTTRCVEALDVTATGIMLAGSDGQIHVITASSEQARLIELFQLQNDEGPCTEAFATGAAVIETNLRTAIDRWPQFTPYAVGAGYRSVYAIPLRLRDNIIGALNLFRAEPGPLATEDIDLAQAIADLASIIILQSQAQVEARERDEQLQHALDSRMIIEQAKGMLAERANIDMASAFDRIRAMSRNTNTKLTDLATNIVNGRVAIETMSRDGLEER